MSRLLCACSLLALAALTACPEAGPPIAAIGYCFGGMAALAMARAGVEIPGIISALGRIRAASPADTPQTNAHFQLLAQGSEHAVT